jgi:ferritin
MKIYKKNSVGNFAEPYYYKLGFYLLITLLLLLLTLGLNILFNFKLLLILIVISIIFIIITTTYIFRLVSYLRLYKGFFSKAQLCEKAIIKSLVDTMTLNIVKQVDRIEVPNVFVDFSRFKNEQKIIVNIERLAGMDNVERLIPLVSNAFRGKYKNFAVIDFVENENKMDFTFILENVKLEKRLIPQSIDELLEEDLYKFKLSTDLTVDFNQTPHLICTGVTGSGKSTFLISLLAQCYNRNNINIYLIDPKREFVSLGSISEPQEILEKLKSIVEEMEARELEVGQKITELGQNAKSFGYAPTMIFIDELTALVAAYDNKQKKEFDSLLRQLVLKGRANSYFVCIFLQNANSETISVAIRNNLNVRIALGNNSSEDYRFIFGQNTETISNDIPKFSGYILIKSVNINPQRFFVPNLIQYKLNSVEMIKGKRF